MPLPLLKRVDFCAFPPGRVVVGSFGSSGLVLGYGSDGNCDVNFGLGGARKFATR